VSHHVVDYDQEGRPTLTTRSDNRATLLFAFLGRGAARVDVVWTNYPPSAADVEECTQWIEGLTKPRFGRVSANAFDVPS
jgi:hypothetical protein